MSDNNQLPQNRIAKLRIDKNLSQSKLAEKTGLTRQAISLYEIGKREPKLETWIKLANFFNVPVSYLQGIELSNKEFVNNISKKEYFNNDFMLGVNDRLKQNIGTLLENKQISKENLLAFDRTFSNTASLLAYLLPQGTNKKIKYDVLEEFSKLIGYLWFCLCGKEPIISSVRLPNEKQEKAEKVNYDNLLALLKELNDKAEKGFSDDKD